MSNVLVIGAQNIDIFAKTTDEYSLRDSNVAAITLAYGGVGRNITENIKRLGNDVSFLTVFGDDTFSIQARESLDKLGIDCEESITVEHSSNSIYLGILDKDNDLYLGLNDMDITASLNKELFIKKLSYINSFDYVVIDNNLSEEAIAYLLTHIKVPKIMDAVSAKKVVKLKQLIHLIDVLKVNKIELNELSKKETTIKQITDLQSRGLKNVLVTDSKNMIYLGSDKLHQEMPIEVDSIVNASGAGDAFLSGFIHGIIENATDDVKLNYAKIMAYHTLLCNEATNKTINKDVLK